MSDKTKRPLYWLWRGMIGRCSNPNHESWKWYGGKGITVCQRWTVFENFEADMSPRPHDKTLDRIDGDGPYSPENCRWATHREQGRNKPDVRKVIIDGRTHLIVDLAEISGHKTDTIVARVAQGLAYSEIIDPGRRHVPERMRGALAHNRKMAEATHCQRGHEFTPENTDHYGNQRRCRECRLVVQARYKARKKSASKLREKLREL